MSLNKLRENDFKLGILSNGDQDMLENAKQFIGFDMDFTISVQEAGYFKPHWKTYRLVELKTRIDKKNCLFVANHAFDCIGAKSFEMHTAFIDRRKRPFGHTPFQPDIIVKILLNYLMCLIIMWDNLLNLIIIPQNLII